MGGGTQTASQSNNQSNTAQSGRVRNRMMQNSTVNADEYYALPNGSYPPLTWFIPQRAGRIGSSNQIYGSGSTSNTLAGGLMGSADFTGSGGLTNASLSLIASLIASLTGSGTATPPAELVGTLNLLSNQLTGEGLVNATLTAFAYATADLIGEGNATLVPYATGKLAADITGQSELSPQSLADAVWKALAAQYSDPDTMAAALKAASNNSKLIAGLF